MTGISISIGELGNRRRPDILKIKASARLAAGQKPRHKVPSSSSKNSNWPAKKHFSDHWSSSHTQAQKKLWLWFISVDNGVEFARTLLENRSEKQSKL